MPDELNLVKNPKFDEGKLRPSRWTWVAPDDGCVWERVPGANGNGACGVEIRAERMDGSASPMPRALWAQRVSVESKQHYRIEASVSVDADDRGGVASECGVVLSVRPMAGEEPRGATVETPPVQCGETTLRAFYETPPGARALDVRVGARGAVRRAVIHEVLVVPILDFEAKSHPNATPPPPHAQPAPRQVRTVCVCDESDEPRPLVRILRARMGGKSVRALRASQMGKTRLDADAIVIPGSLPRGVRSMGALLALAEHHVVVLSPPALAALSRGVVEVRTVRQKDDPLSATVYESNFITRGFALRDIFPFASRGIGGSDPRIFVQRQFRRSRPFVEFCKKHGFVTVLRSETDNDATSEKPVALYRPAPGGGIFVFDVEPIESGPSTLNEPSLALRLLLNALGDDAVSLGKYTVPARTHREFWEEMFDFSQRFPEYAVHGIDPPYHEDARPLVELGRASGRFGLAGANRPVILIRTGLSGDDLHGVYGVMYWLKQLVRTVPHECPYVRMLTERYCIAWVPQCVEWPVSTGWRRGESAAAPFEANFGSTSVAAVIDVTETPRQELRIVLPGRNGDFSRYGAVLPDLWRELHGGRYFGWSPEAGQPLGDHRSYAWRCDSLIPRVATDKAAFATGFHRSAAATGARLVRIETPNSPSDTICSSIWRTDQVASMLELLVGMEVGLIVSNRRCAPVRLTLPPAVAADHGRVRILRAGNDPGEISSSPLPGVSSHKATLRPGETLCHIRK